MLVWQNTKFKSNLKAARATDHQSSATHPPRWRHNASYCSKIFCSKMRHNAFYSIFLCFYITSLFAAECFCIFLQSIVLQNILLQNILLQNMFALCSLKCTLQYAGCCSVYQCIKKLQSTSLGDAIMHVCVLLHHCTFYCRVLYCRTCSRGLPLNVLLNALAAAMYTSASKNCKARHLLAADRVFDHLRDSKYFSPQSIIVLHFVPSNSQKTFSFYPKLFWLGPSEDKKALLEVPGRFLPMDGSICAVIV